MHVIYDRLRTSRFNNGTKKVWFMDMKEVRL
jgi:hypothetical protein